MTIKQLGGVFGRNPTFNDVTIEGTLTFDGDIDIDSDLTISGDLYLPDNSKAIFGTGSDLQIYHDGSHSYIKDTATGNLRIDGTDIQIRSDAGANMAAFVTGAEVQLYHNNQKKFETTATGINVDGVARVDGNITIGRTTGSYIFTEVDGGNERAGIHSSADNDLTFKVNNQITAINIDGATRDISFHNAAGTSQSLFWDASEESLGIGTTSPSGKLNLSSSANTVFRLDDTNGTSSYHHIETSGANGQNLIISGDQGGTGGGAFIVRVNGASEAMRIDSSKNLLVGTTDSTPYNNTGAGNGGAGIQADGLISAAREDLPPAIFNRLVSDGKIIEIRKDGALIGEIGSQSGDVYISSSASGHGGLRFANGSILPLKDGSLNAGEIDLGQASGDLGFKDLYLAGGVVFGTTGGNVTSKTLDDYEEGTWTPVLSFAGGSTGITHANQDGKYTKVGRLVTAYIRVGLTNNGTDTGLCNITLPFAVGEVMTTTAVQGGSPVTFVENFSGSYYSLNAHPWEGTSTVRLYQRTSVSGNSNYQVTESEISNTFDCRITVQYMTA